MVTPNDLHIHLLGGHHWHNVDQNTQQYKAVKYVGNVHIYDYNLSNYTHSFRTMIAYLGVATIPQSTLQLT
jgi:hypothetical protein